MKLLQAAGLYHLALAAFHLGFWRLFGWKSELARLHRINAAVMQVLNICLTLVFLWLAWMQLVNAPELLGSRVGRQLVAAVAGFWVLRALQQPAFFGLRHRASRVAFAIFCGGALLQASPLLAT